LHPELVSPLEGPTLPELIAMRVEALRGVDDYRWQLRNWDNSYNSDLDAVFYDEELPGLFSDAVNLTGFALNEFQRRVKQDGGHLVVLTTSQMSLPRVPRSGGKEDPLISRRQFLRLEAIARTLGIPVIDQYTYIVQKGGNLFAAQFKHDAHWTPQGHIWASEAVLEYLEQNPQICGW
jgi:SGNH hydrolase-like domain, acetyltransferase AlgX